MKKFTIMALAALMTATLFAGCRRNPDPTGSTATTAKPTSTTAPTAKPTTKPTTKPAETTRPDGTGVLPDATDLVPDMTSGSNGARGNMGPRY